VPPLIASWTASITSFHKPFGSGAAPSVLARHRQPVAAVIAASVLDGMPADGERIDVQALLEEGGKVTLEYDPGESGVVDDQGDELYPPVPGGFTAAAVDWQGGEIGYGGGDTLAEALLHIHRKQPGNPRTADTGNPWAADSGAYSDEPPF
jgi:hypothetical protein